MATVYGSLRAIEEFEGERIRSRILAGLGAPLNIGLTDATRRTADMPLYTLRRISTR